MKLPIFVIIIVILGSCHINKKNCNDFHLGVFKNVDPVSGTTLITRKNNTQTEIKNDIGYSVKLSIVWLDDCRYTLKLLEVLENRAAIPTDTSMIMTVEILEVRENSYMQKTSSNKSSRVYESEISRID